MRKNPANYAGPAQSGTFYDITDAVVGRGYEFNAQSWAYTAGLFESSAELTEKSVVMDGYELVLENYYSISQESRGNVNSVIGAYEGRYVSREALISNLRQNGIEIKERIVVGDTRLEITAEGVKSYEIGMELSAQDYLMPLRDAVGILNDYFNTNIKFNWDSQNGQTTVTFQNGDQTYSIVYNLKNYSVMKFLNNALSDMVYIGEAEAFKKIYMMKTETGGDVIKVSMRSYGKYAGLDESSLNGLIEFLNIGQMAKENAYANIDAIFFGTYKNNESFFDYSLENESFSNLSSDIFYAGLKQTWLEVAGYIGNIAGAYESSLQEVGDPYAAVALALYKVLLGEMMSQEGQVEIPETYGDSLSAIIAVNKDNIDAYFGEKVIKSGLEASYIINSDYKYLITDKKARQEFIQRLQNAKKDNSQTVVEQAWRGQIFDQIISINENYDRSRKIVSANVKTIQEIMLP